MRRTRRVAALGASAAALLASVGATGCASQEYPDSETARWLRAADGYDESPEVIRCVEQAMHDLLSPAELQEWLSRVPETITVEEIQSLPHAIEIADRCRHL